MRGDNVTNTAASSDIDAAIAQLSADDENILMSLPYRIGLYVSYADISGGWDAQEKEQQSLAGILRAYSEDFCKSELTQKILMETLGRRPSWPAWSQKIDTVPDEVARIIFLIAPLVDPRELAGFKEVMIDVALSVAMAFHEGDEVHAPTPETGSFFSDLVARFLPQRTKTDFDHVNISPAERAALTRVCMAMDYKAR